MPDHISPQTLDAMRTHPGSLALLDAREAGEYNAAHIPDARLVPFTGAQVVLCDDDGRRAALAVATLERMGYTRVAVLDGGINRWAASGYPTEWGDERLQQGFR